MIVEEGSELGPCPLLPERWSQHWRDAPDAPVLLVGGEEPKWQSGAELDERTLLATGALVSAGVATGDRVVWEATSSLAAIVSALGVLRLGATLVPVSDRQSELERRTVIDDVSPSLVLSQGHPGDGAGAMTASQLLGGRAPAAPPAVVEPDDLALIIYTSGTTGQPKGAMLTHGNLAAQATSLSSAWGWTPDDRLVSALPLFHVHGLVVALFGSLAAGASVIVEPGFDPGRMLHVADAESASMTFCVPTMLHRLRGHASAAVLQRFRLVVSGSAPLSSELFEWYRRELGVTILERYGMTETLLTVSNPLAGERRPGTVGRALPGVSLELPEDGEAELRVAGPTVFAGYWRRPEATKEILSDGWVSTGDIVQRDEAGYVVICGRSKELIISGGFNVYPTEVEDVLRSLPGISDAAVVGRPSEEWGEEVVAFVVGDPGFDVERVQVEAAAQLSAYKVPRRFHVVDELPRNALGKLQRHLL